MKRFYKKVEVRELEAGRFEVLLDDCPIKTPAKLLLTLPNAGLSQAIAVEWEVQEETINPSTMPLMRYTATALDRVATQRQAVIDEIAAFGASDLFCQRADSPQDLVTRQSAAWQPLLDWADEMFQAKLIVTTGIMPVDQPPDAVAALRAVVAGCDDMTLAGLHGITSITGSLIIGLAVLDGRLDAEDAWELSQLDETFQVEQWGEDEEATARRVNLRTAVLDAARFLALIN
ncbi:MAG TPA: ATPase [Sneathiellales bacterium]|nr:ATPase [Sneathiellales bacterium]